MKFAVVRITELRRRDDPDKILGVCLRHNLLHNLINVPRLTVAGETRNLKNHLGLRPCTLNDNLWKVVNSFIWQV